AAGQFDTCAPSSAAFAEHNRSWAQWIRSLPIRMGSRSRSPEPCARHVHGLLGSSCWIFSCLILSRVEASTKPGVIHFDYVKVFYNRKRRHSHLGGLSPEAFEAASA